MSKHSPSLIEQVLSGYVQIESARLGGRLSTQPEQQNAAVNSIGISRNSQASSPKKPFYKNTGMIVAGVVVVVGLIFAVTRK